MLLTFFLKASSCCSCARCFANWSYTSAPRPSICSLCLLLLFCRCCCRCGWCCCCCCCCCCCVLVVARCCFLLYCCCCRAIVVAIPVLFFWLSFSIFYISVVPNSYYKFNIFCLYRYILRNVHIQIILHHKPDLTVAYFPAGDPSKIQNRSTFLFA